MNVLPADVGALIKHWRRLTPDQDAVRFGRQSWTWAQFADRVDRNAGAQLAAGLRPGDRVAVWARNSPVHLETMMACLRVGTVLVPVNFRFSAEEVRYLLRDARARLLIVGAEFRPVAGTTGPEPLSVARVVVSGGAGDQYERWLANADPCAGRPLPPEPEACFLQVYTSGTTGFPKGAMLTNANLTAHSAAVGSATGAARDTVWMAGTSSFHITGPAWALIALYHGACVVVAADTSPPALLDEIVGQRVTHVITVPATLAAFLDIPGAADRDYSHIRSLTYAAAPMPPSTLQRCLDTLPVPLLQGYGMTECSLAATILSDRDHRDTAYPHRLASVGKPIPGVELMIGDLASGEPVRHGQTGEVLLRSRQVMLGYWNPVAGPDTSAITEDGWLHTGDSGYLDEDGYLYLTGRLKDMYIRDGNNVYAAEVERVLAEHPDVAEAAVIGVPDPEWGEAGLAFLVAADGAEVDAAGVLRMCRERLAGYKCPDSLVIVSELPRNVIGKVAKDKLPRAGRPSTGTTAPVRAPGQIRRRGRPEPSGQGFFGLIVGGLA